MVKTQIRITQEQHRILKSMALVTGVSVPELIRQSIEHFIQASGRAALDERRQQALEIAGKYLAEPDLAKEHDRYLAEAFGDFRHI